MNVQVLYFVGCPNHAPAVELVRDVVAKLGVEAEVVEVKVTNPADAERLRFLGSPTILVDGVDIEPAARDRADFGFSCRTYDGQGTPPREMLAAALLEPVAPKEAGGIAQACCGPSLSSDDVRSDVPGQRAGRWAVAGSVVSAFAASACCWIPLVLIALGISAGGFGAWFEKYRVLFLGVTALLLGTGFYFVYFRTPVCAPGSACAAPNLKLQRFNQVMLWVATVVVIASATFPNYVDHLLAGSAPAAATVPAQQLATLNLRVDGMTCGGCAAFVQNALQKVPGVQSASASYPQGRAVVTFDPSSPPRTSSLVEAVERGGYQATPELGDK